MNVDQNLFGLFCVEQHGRQSPQLCPIPALYSSAPVVSQVATLNYGIILQAVSYVSKLEAHGNTTSASKTQITHHKEA